jgi:hypothetical protein
MESWRTCCVGLYLLNGLSSKSQVARALEITRGTLYHKGKQAVKEKAVATAIEQWHEQDDTRSSSETSCAAGDGEKPRQTGDET